MYATDAGWFRSLDAEVGPASCTKDRGILQEVEITDAEFRAIQTKEAKEFGLDHPRTTERAGKQAQPQRTVIERDALARIRTGLLRAARGRLVPVRH